MLFAIALKYTEGFTRLVSNVLVVVAASAGIYFLTLPLRDLPVSIAYPIWTGIGTLGTVLLGALLLGEALTPLKLLSIALIVAGIAGLNSRWSGC